MDRRPAFVKLREHRMLMLGGAGMALAGVAIVCCDWLERTWRQNH